MSYQVYGNGNREYRSDNASKVANVAVEWKKNGLEPKLWKVGIPDADGPVRMVEVKTEKSIKKTAKNLVSARYDQ